jgi:hypothetical protein
MNLFLQLQVLFSWHCNLLGNSRERQVLSRNRIWCLVLLLLNLDMARHSPVLNRIRLLLPIRQRNVESEDISFSVAFMGVLLPPGLVHHQSSTPRYPNPYGGPWCWRRRGELDLLGHRDELGLVRVWYFGWGFARQREGLVF